MFSGGLLINDILRGLLYLAPRVLIFVALIFYLNKKKDTEVILMMTGTVIFILFTIFNTLVYPFLIQNMYENMNYNSVILSSVPGLISLAGTFMFAIGFFMMVNNLFKKGNTKQNDLNSRIEEINK